MVLKPQDVVVLVFLQTLGGEKWTYDWLSKQVRVSAATIHEGLQTAAAAKLYSQEDNRPIRRNLLEFLKHGVKYAYPPKRGEMVRGVLTSYAASPLVSKFPPSTEPAPVWPFAGGVARGYSFEPLYGTVPEVALEFPHFGEYMALIDAIRDGRPRESQTAVQELNRRMAE